MTTTREQLLQDAIAALQAIEDANDAFYNSDKSQEAVNALYRKARQQRTEVLTKAKEPAEVTEQVTGAVDALRQIATLASARIAETPDLPKRVDAMSEAEHAIFKTAVIPLAALQTIQRIAEDALLTKQVTEP